MQVFFAPFYFNHVMTAQMTGGGRTVRVGPCDEATMLPDLDWLERTLQVGNRFSSKDKLRFQTEP
jgi:hypothetical protein